MTGPIHTPSPAVLERAVSLLEQGQLVAIPTETVYGLGADASNANAVASIYALKDRPSFNPLIAHCKSVDAAFAHGQVTPGARKLANAFWPGPLTLVLEATEHCAVCRLARAGLDTIAVRVPAHPVLSELLQIFGRPIVAPSANPSGRISPTRAEHVAADFGDQIEMILQGGPSAAGLESTIVDARESEPVLLRKGPISQSDIEAVWPGLKTNLGAPDAPRAPGQLLRHYAPNAALRLNVITPEAGELLLGFGQVVGDVTLSATGDLSEAAANLFDHIRSLDTRTTRIAVAPIPEHGIGAAINDRLTRAAEKR
ncbi:MAG: L-threonylcarbamoyladenylate synthase [Pseudomonadota bacterium]